MLPLDFLMLSTGRKSIIVISVRKFCVVSLVSVLCIVNTKQLRCAMVETKWKCFVANSVGWSSLATSDEKNIVLRDALL